MPCSAAKSVTALRNPSPTRSKIAGDGIGNPYRGAAKTVEQLVSGVRQGIGPLSITLTDFARSLLSLHQLLSSYACINHAGSLHRLGKITMP
jgi:hypothetical protein